MSVICIGRITRLVNRGYYIACGTTTPLRNTFHSHQTRMADPRSYFVRKDHAAEYKQFRRGIPEAIVDKIVNFLSKKHDPSTCVAVDIGCGSGQSTFATAKYIGTVIGIDTSEAQITEGNKEKLLPNVEFRVGNAESIPVSDNSVHLLYAMNAAHWFDLPTFYKEADRVLVPGGVLALCSGEHGFAILGHDEESARLFNEFEMTECKQYWNPRVTIPDGLYSLIILPYKDSVRDTSVVTDDVMSVAFLMKRLRTISGIAKFLQAEPEKAEKALETLQDRYMKLVKATGTADETTITVRKKYVALLGYKPA